jgi:GNAT superfamily N-acetyltransferase
MTRVSVHEVTPGDPAIEALIELGDQSRRTLGLMPRQAYWEAAQQRCLLAATIDGALVGYALFRLPRNNKVALSHLCVAEHTRRQGVAHALMECIKTTHSDRWGIQAKCRDDYALDSMWKALGFAARAATLGRGKERSPMTVWWLDHGHPDLFSLIEPELLSEEPDLLEAALDVNILMDLHTRPAASTTRRSQVLEADHLDGRLRLVVTDGTDHDLARHAHSEPNPVLVAAARYPRRAAPDGHSAALHAQLKAASQGRTLTAQDEGDLWQIAAAAASGIDILLTWDDKMRTTFESLRERVPALGSLRVLDPDHVITHLDELARRWAYQPARLHGSEYDQVRAGAGDESALLAFQNNPAGERHTALRDTTRRLAREQIPQWLIRRGDQPPIACYAAHVDGEVLRVPLLRVADHPLADTLARQLLLMLRRDARSQRARVVDIADRHLSAVLSRAAALDAFLHHGDHWYGWVIPVCGTGREITTSTNQARALVGMSPGPLVPRHIPAQAVAELERALWPAKITDGALPHYIVPIQRRWSSDLLGYPAQLIDRRIELALGRELIYYRSADNRLRAPARILWRVSKDNHHPAEIVATSLLDAIDVDTPENLHSRYSHYGVFTLSHLRAAAKGKPVMQALTVSDTELFDTPIGEHSYQAMRREQPGPAAFYGPQPVSNDLFSTLYQAGHAQ